MLNWCLHKALIRFDWQKTAWHAVYSISYWPLPTLPKIRQQCPVKSGSTTFYCLNVLLLIYLIKIIIYYPPTINGYINIYLHNYAMMHYGLVILAVLPSTEISINKLLEYQSNGVGKKQNKKWAEIVEYGIRERLALCIWKSYNFCLSFGLMTMLLKIASRG